MFNLFGSNKTQVDFNSFEYLAEEFERRLDPLTTIGSSNDILNFPEESERYKAVRKDYLKAAKCFETDKDKLKLVMKYWTDYCDSLQEIIFAKKMVDISSGGESMDLYETMNEEVSKIKEIEKEFVNLLGDRSELKRVINK